MKTILEYMDKVHVSIPRCPEDDVDLWLDDTTMDGIENMIRADNRDKAALKFSLAKWIVLYRTLRDNQGRTVNGTSADHCPLCKIYIHHNCFGCPISSSTYQPLCVLTPYKQAAEAMYDNEIGHGEKLSAVREEIGFLIELVRKNIPDIGAEITDACEHVGLEM